MTNTQLTTESTTTEPVDFGATDRGERSDEMTAQIESWVADLAEGIGEARADARFQEYLETMARFHNYSRRNQLLIQMQHPGATKVAGYRQWQDKFNRHVKEGESAIYILRPRTITAKKCPYCDNAPNYHTDNETLECPIAPADPAEDPDVNVDEWDRGEILIGFAPASVFDVSQTEGEPLPERPGEVAGVPDGLREAVIAAGEARDVDVAVVPASEWVRPEDGYMRPGTPPQVRVKEDDSRAAATLVHELAHAELHTGQTDLDREGREVEAEAVAYVVGRHFGLEMSDSEFYLAAWTDDETDLLADRFEWISNTAQALIETIEEHR